jgi:hypothetical protein
MHKSCSALGLGSQQCWCHANCSSGISPVTTFTTCSRQSAYIRRRIWDACSVVLSLHDPLLDHDRPGGFAPRQPIVLILGRRGLLVSYHADLHSGCLFLLQGQSRHWCGIPLIGPARMMGRGCGSRHGRRSSSESAFGPPSFWRCWSPTGLSSTMRIGPGHPRASSASRVSACPCAKVASV